MQKWKIAGMMLMLCVVTRMSAQEDSNYERRVRSYIEQFKTLAIQEQKRSGIPAAITLAQGIHETSAGNSELATEANNHFGIKCKKEWKGMTFAHTDDAVDECFRKYNKAEESYADHSNYLKGSPRYAALFALSPTDYAGWAVGLKRCGYATNPRYSQVLISLIEEYHLQDYTYAALGGDDYNPVKDAQKASDRALAVRTAEVVPEADAAPPQIAVQKKRNIQVSYNAKQPEVVKEATDQVLEENPAIPEYNKLVKVNGLKAFYARKGTLLLNDAFKYNLRYARLLELNDLPDAPIEADMYIYLEKKNTKGPHQLHVVKPGETLAQVAQSESIQLKYLKFYNHIGANEEPVAGALLQLQEYSEDKPETVAREDARRIQSLSFAGDAAPAIPPGATRRSSKAIRQQVEQGTLVEATPPPTPAERRAQKIAAQRLKKQQELLAKLDRQKAPAKEEAPESDAPLEASLPVNSNGGQTTAAAGVKPIGSFRQEMSGQETKLPAKKAATHKAEAAKPVADAEPPVETKKEATAAIKTAEVISEAPAPVTAAPDAKIGAAEKADKEAQAAPVEPAVMERTVPSPAVAVKEESKPLAESQAVATNSTGIKEEQKTSAEAPTKETEEVADKQEAVAAAQSEKEVVASADIPEVRREDIIANRFQTDEVKSAEAAEDKSSPASDEAKPADVPGQDEAEEKKDGPETASEAPARQDDLALVLAAKKGDVAPDAPTPPPAEVKTEPETPASPPKEAAASEEKKPEAVAAVSAGNGVETEAGPLQPAAPADIAEPAKQAATEPVAAPPPPAPPKPAPAKEPEEPRDEFARLKAQLDKVVYASEPPASASPVAPSPEVKKEAAAVREPAAKNGAKNETSKPSKKYKTYTVRKGDTAFIIARRNNITLKQLQEWNKLDSKAIQEGQQLRVSK